MALSLLTKSLDEVKCDIKDIKVDMADVKVRIAVIESRNDENRWTFTKVSGYLNIIILLGTALVMFFHR